MYEILDVRTCIRVLCNLLSALLSFLLLVVLSQFYDFYCTLWWHFSELYSRISIVNFIFIIFLYIFPFLPVCCCPIIKKIKNKKIREVEASYKVKIMRATWKKALRCIKRHKNEYNGWKSRGERRRRRWGFEKQYSIAMQLTDELWSGSKCYIKHDFQFVKRERARETIGTA